MPLSKDEKESLVKKCVEEAERLVTQGLTESEKADRQKIIDDCLASLTPIPSSRGKLRAKKKSKQREKKSRY